VKRWLPATLFAVSGVLFGICAVLQFLFASQVLGAVFAILALVGITAFIALRTGRITW
jgi:Flp pilus assembly protein protease CpaA